MTNSPFLSLALCWTLLIASLAANAQSFSWTAEDSNQLTRALESGTYGQVSSVWIEVEGHRVFEAYLQGTDASTTHNMRSAGKTVTGMLLGAAIDDGLIDSVDTKAATFFPELQPFEHADPRKDAITIKDLITMSGPLECDDWNSFSRGNEERMYLVEDWSAFFWNLPIKNRPSWEIPETDSGFGRLYSYCTAGVQLVGEIVERATGKPFPEYAAERLFDTIGIKTPKWNYAATGKAHLGGGIELTTPDWARAARLYVNGGRSGRAQIISEAWVEASLADYVQIDDRTNYGYLWWRPEYEVAGRKYRANMMSGSGGNRVWALPEFKVVAVLSKNDFRDGQAHPKSDAFFAAEIVERLGSR